MTSKLMFAVVSLCAALSFGVAQAAAPVEAVLKADSLEQFQEQAAMVRENMNAGGRYEFIRPADRAIVDKRLNEIATALEKSGSADQVNSHDLAKVLTAQEQVNALLANNDGKRLICERVYPTGSHMAKTECVTLAERERGRRDARKYMNDNARRSISNGEM